jgi:hypothetical protein
LRRDSCQLDWHCVQKIFVVPGSPTPCSIAVERRKPLILARCSRRSSCSISFFLRLQRTGYVAHVACPSTQFTVPMGTRPHSRNSWNTPVVASSPPAGAHTGRPVCRAHGRPSSGSQRSCEQRAGCLPVGFRCAGGSAYAPSLTNGSPFLGAMSAAGRFGAIGLCRVVRERLGYPLTNSRSFDILELLGDSAAP